MKTHWKWIAAAAGLAAVLAGVYAGWLPAKAEIAAAPPATAAAPTSAPITPPAAGPLAASAPPPLAASSGAAPPDDDDRIGSEGFAPRVQRAIDDGDPAQALEATRWIASCKPDFDVESALNGSNPNYHILVPEGERAAAIESVRRTQRRCQTLTPDLLAHQRELAQRAVDAHLPGAGVAFYRSLDRDHATDAERSAALAALRADVGVGEPMAVPILALSTPGLPRSEQLAYQQLMDHLITMGRLPPMMGGLGPPPQPEPPWTPDEQAQAAQLLKKLLPPYRTRHG